MVGVDDFNVCGGLDITGSDGACTLFLEPELNRFFAVDLKVDAFEIQCDVDDVFLDAGDGCELMCRTFDAERDNCAAADT